MLVCVLFCFVFALKKHFFVFLEWRLAEDICSHEQAVGYTDCLHICAEPHGCSTLSSRPLEGKGGDLPKKM